MKAGWRIVSVALGSFLGAVGCSRVAENFAAPTAPSTLSLAGQESACDHASPRAPWSGETCYDPQLVAADFAGVAENNPYFPLVPGTTWRYESESKEGAEVNTVEVTGNVKVIDLPGGGMIQATEVLDQVYACDELADCDLVLDNLAEKTRDWYARSVDGTTWYLGEYSEEYEGGVVVSTEGSWEAYVDGAFPGIIMLPDPHVGDTYRQEFEPDVAEDLARVVGLNRSVSVPFGDFDGCLETQEWNALENASQETKLYCMGVGTVMEIAKQNVHVELVDMVSP